MKYRIKQIGKEFHPQFKWWNLIWIDFLEYDRTAEKNLYKCFYSIEEADKYLEQKKKDNEVTIYKR